MEDSTTSESLPVGDALKHAFIVAWKYKWFWPLAFLLNPQILGIDFLYPAFDYTELPETEVIVMIAIAVLAYMLFISFATALIQPTLILAVDKYKQGVRPGMKDCLRQALDYFWKVWLLGVVWFLAGMMTLLLLIVPVVIAFAIHTAMGVLAVLVVLLIALAIALVVLPIAAYSYRHVVLNNAGVFDSISESYNTFRSMKGRSIGALIASFAIILGAYLAVTIPGTFIQLLLELQGAYESLAFLAFYLPIAFVLSLVFVGYFQAFSSAVWTLVFPEVGSSASSTSEVESVIV